MNQPLDIKFPIAKAEYLLTCIAKPGEGGDKQNYWQNILGFDSAESIRQAILAEVSLDRLQSTGKHPYGDSYIASIQIDTPNGRSKPIKTVWLVRFGENIARFVTAVPEHKKGD
jgi:hypothetical protein